MANEFIAASDTWEAGGKTWTLSPISIKDLKELEAYLRNQGIAFVNQLEGLSQEDKRYLLDKAWAEVRNLRIGTTAFDEALGSLNGITHLLFIVLRKGQPNVNKAEVEDLVTLDRVEELMQKFTALMGVTLPNDQKAA